jgi:hypothetical protein
VLFHAVAASIAERRVFRSAQIKPFQVTENLEIAFFGKV